MSTRPQFENFVSELHDWRKKLERLQKRKQKRKRQQVAVFIFYLIAPYIAVKLFKAKVVECTYLAVVITTVCILVLVKILLYLLSDEPLQLSKDISMAKQKIRSIEAELSLLDFTIDDTQQ